MLAVINLPNDKDFDDMCEAVENEVDMIFDYIDARCEDGADPSDVAAAMLVVLKLITENVGGDIESVH